MDLALSPRSAKPQPRQAVGILTTEDIGLASGIGRSPFVEVSDFFLSRDKLAKEFPV